MEQAALGYAHANTDATANERSKLGELLDFVRRALERQSTEHLHKQHQICQEYSRDDIEVCPPAQALRMLVVSLEERCEGQVLGMAQVRLTKHPRVSLCHNWRLTVQFDPEELDGRKTR